MSNEELDRMIDWCQRKSYEKVWEYNRKGLTNSAKGYREAMLNFASYLHGMKKENRRCGDDG